MKKKSFYKLLLTFMISAFIPILMFGILSISVTQNNLKKQIVDRNDIVLNNTSIYIKSMFDDIIPIQTLIDTNSSIAYNFKRVFTEKNYSTKTTEFIKISDKFMSTFSNVSHFIDSIYIFFNNDYERFYSTKTGISSISKENVVNKLYDTEWLNIYLDNKDKSEYWSLKRKVPIVYSNAQGMDIVSVFKTTSTSEGVIVMNIRADYYNKELSSYLESSGQSLIIVNTRNEVLFEVNTIPNMNSVLIKEGKKLDFNNDVINIDNNKYIVSSMDIDFYDWNIISLTPYMLVYSVQRKMSYLLMLLLIFALFISAILANMFAKNNKKQIDKILRIIIATEKGEDLTNYEFQIKDEYDIILNNMIRSFANQNKLNLELAKRQYELETKELYALQSQINPHFMFNTLESINLQIVDIVGKPVQANKMISALSSILRYSLSSPRGYVRIEEEIYYTKAYLEIMKFRYIDRFTVDWYYSINEIKDKYICKLILQPLVENSIYHGIKEKNEMCKLLIIIKCDKKRIELSVTDTGIGMSQEKIKSIKERLISNEESYNDIGLMNVYKRLKIMYDSKVDIRIYSKQNIGTTIKISIPSCLIMRDNESENKCV